MQRKVRVNIFAETLDFRKIYVIIVVIDETKRQVLASSLAFQADLSEFDSLRTPTPSIYQEEVLGRSDSPLS